MRRNTEQDFWEKVCSGDIDECWEWTGLTNGGYGRISFGNRRVYAHVLAYQFVNGDIPDGMQINHTCDNRKCCNPEHLYAGTSSDNAIDAVVRKRHVNSRKTECVRGHPFDEWNTRVVEYHGKVWRQCRACHTERAREKRRKEVAA